MQEHSETQMTRMVEIDQHETVATRYENEEATRGQQTNITQLAANFDDIVRSGAIYYPVSYRFIREMGRGRQGVVYLASRHGARGCTTQHSLKLFDPRLYRNVTEYWTDMGRIADQISRLHGINSPYLVSRQMYEEMNGIGYIQMEVIRGFDLEYLLHGNHREAVRSLSTNEEWSRFDDVIFRPDEHHLAIQPGIVLFIIRSALRGLEPLHENGFLHSDIKPSNIMIDQTGYVKIIDFGRAVRAQEPTRYLFGTPQYMAPELHRRDPGTPSSDLYSVGLVALELLRGRPLVEHSSKVTEKSLLEAKLKLPDQLCDLLPSYVTRNEQFVHALRKLLDPEPENRFKSAEDAESGPEGLRLLHRQLTFAGKDTQYDRELEFYLEKYLASEKSD